MSGGAFYYQCKTPETTLAHADATRDVQGESGGGVVGEVTKGADASHWWGGEANPPTHTPVQLPVYVKGTFNPPAQD